MKTFLLRLFAGFVALLAVGPALFGQNVQLSEQLTALVRPTTSLVGLTPAGALRRSTDNGVAWTTVRAADNPQALYALAASGSTLVAMGDAANFVRSTDNGATWSTLASALSPAHGGPIRALAANGSTWIAVGQSGNNISVVRSTNGGVAWSRATTPAVLGTLHCVAWTGSRWVAVGGGGVTGFIYTSTDGASWTQLTTTAFELYAVASDGAGRVLAVGDACTVLFASDHAATASSFTDIGNGVVSEALRAVTFLSGTNWVIGGDNAVLLTYNGSTVGVAAGPSATTTAAYTALAFTGTGANYYFALSGPAGLEPQGPISLQIAIVGGQLQLTLVGAQNGYTYHLESSTTLASWTPVAGSNRAFSTGQPAPTWTAAVPGAGARVFYRVRVGAL